MENGHAKDQAKNKKRLAIVLQNKTGMDDPVNPLFIYKVKICSIIYD
jgi:hypothetical protein